MTEVVSVRPAGAVSVVAFDDGTSFRCTRDFVRRSHLSRGQQIEEVFVARLRDSASLDLATSEAQRLNRRRRYSRREIANKLTAAGISANVAREALDELEQLGTLNDHMVALDLARKGLRQALSRDPHLQRNRFRMMQTRRLALRGFDPATAAQACNDAWSAMQ